MRPVAVMAALCALLASTGCIRPSPPIDPASAPAEAASALRAVLQRTPPARHAAAPSPPLATVDGPVTVSVWYPDHPLMRRLASAPVRHAFAEAHPGITLDAQGIGDWMYAVQKLTVHLAGGGLPDIAVVRRDLLAQLVPSGRILALDTLLPPALVADLEDPVFAAFSAGPQLVALPADAFHSVLYTAEGESLAHLDDLLASGAESRAVIGHLPFLEVLWAEGGRVLDGESVVIDDEAAGRAFERMHALYAPGHGRAEPFAAFDETHGVSLYLSGRAPMTVASSRGMARLLEQRPETRIQPIPGVSGGVSRWGEYAIVVFEGAEAKGEAIAAVLDFLTGPAVQGAEALAMGSPPVRRSVRDDLGAPHPLLDTWRSVRAAPLVAAWGEAEQVLATIVERTMRFRGPRLAVASGSG